MSHKRILIISWHFLPYKSSSAFNLFKRIKDTGYTYDVIQIARKEKPSNEGMFEYAKSKFNRYEIEVPSEDSRNVENREFFAEAAMQLFKKLREENHYHAVLSHSHEIASHIVTQRIKKAFPELPWIASFGDPIAANPYNESYKFPLLEEDSQTEAETLSEADRIVVTNEYQKELVLKNETDKTLGEKFFILPHCFDERMYKQSNVNSEKFRFMHIGMLYKYKRTSEPFIEGARHLLKKYPEYRDRFSVEFYGANDRYIKDAEASDLEGVVHFGGVVNYLDSLSLMTAADCLLLRDADFSDQGLQHTPFYPGKLADYLGAKKPVIAVTMKTGCVPDMFESLELPSLTEHDIDGIADAMKKSIDGELSPNLTGIEEYSVQSGAQRAKQMFEFDEKVRKVVVAGHDLKFAKFIIEELEANPKFDVIIDQWKGHDKHDEAHSRKLLEQADVIFCEWGLGNAVWYSQHKKSGQKLVVRVHAQELKTRHLDKVNKKNVDNYIFVSPYYFELMIKEFSLEREKCKMVFNLVDTELLDKPKKEEARFNLGMIGDVPQSKRLDRALDIFEELYKKDKRYKLFVKGKRPEDYAWMHSEARKPEMDYYRFQYQRIEDNGWSNNVFFEGHGPIDEWLQSIGWILSVSDNESFHLAAAEGMASGSIPIILNWDGAEQIYPKKYIYENQNCASKKVMSSNKRSYTQEGVFCIDYSAKLFTKENVKNILKCIGE